MRLNTLFCRSCGYLMVYDGINKTSKCPRCDGVMRL
jgi:predicted Zn-ribbon and HTH transcriptional regulator